LGTDAFGDFFGAAQIGLGQYQHELVAAVARGRVDRAATGPQ
jgi:hypothetical protein